NRAGTLITIRADHANTGRRRQSGRRGFLRNGVLLGVGVAVFGVGPGAARKSAEKGGFVVINGWVLPSEYFKDGRA
ncbi:hypothetical protein PpSQ1_27085, partial [Pseudomonas putida]